MVPHNGIPANVIRIAANANRIAANANRIAANANRSTLIVVQAACCLRARCWRSGADKTARIWDASIPPQPPATP